MRYEVEMWAWADGAVRTVDVPDAEALGDKDLRDSIFKYGQNDFQPRKMPSVSVGDVIRLGGKKWRVEPCGFKEVPAGYCNRAYGKTYFLQPQS